MAILNTSRLYNLLKLRMIHEIDTSRESLRPSGRGRVPLAINLSRQRCKLHPVGFDLLLATESAGTIHFRADLDREGEDDAGPIETQVFLALKKLCLEESKLCLTEFRGEGLRKPIHLVVFRGWRLPQIQILYSQAERNRSRQAGMRRRDEVEH